MNNYIESTGPNLNVLNGLFSSTVKFSPRLNFISGENGTLKTKFLQQLKGGQNIICHQNNPCTIQAVSPQRRAVRKNVEAILQQLRQENTNLKSLNKMRNINDNVFENYPSLGELYYALYNDLCGDGGNQIEKMNEVTELFNKFIKSLFSHYELISKWENKKPTIYLLKNGISHVPLEGLSLGEQEMLSLVANFYTSRGIYDVFLVDEPEVHLNWHLEETLFQYLDDFCEEYQKQMIIVTHSRAIFKKRFISKTQFFVWEEGKVTCTKNISKEQRIRIAGDAIEIIRWGDFLRTTFFVEDAAHEKVVLAIAEMFGADVDVFLLGSSSKVESHYKVFKKEGRLKNVFFIIDGDNEKHSFPNNDSFIHLNKYCIENYLLDINVASEITDKSKDEIRQIIFDLIFDNDHNIFKKNKNLDFLLVKFKVEDITDENLSKFDVSVIMNKYLSKIEMSLKEYIWKYISKCHELGKIHSILPYQIVEAINKSLDIPEDEVELVSSITEGNNESNN